MKRDEEKIEKTIKKKKTNIKVLSHKLLAYSRNNHRKN
jgi:hypothetical protein